MCSKQPIRYIMTAFQHGYTSILVGGAITILKNDGVKVNGKDDIPFIMEKMFQTTNQLM